MGRGFGGTVEAGLASTVMTVAGIAAGLLVGPLFAKFKNLAMPIAWGVTLIGLGLTLIAPAFMVLCVAGFVVALTGDILTMPGLPRVPAAEQIDVTDDGRITGLF